MHAFLFPGQGSQYPGMGLDLRAMGPWAQSRLDLADQILGYPLQEVLCNGNEDDLKATKVTQPAVFLYSVIWAEMLGDRFSPAMVAGHSLGEFSALTAAGALTFEDGLRLVALRASAMQKACEEQPSTMAAILGLDDERVVEICASVTAEKVVAANFNCPGQVVISGGPAAVLEAGQKALEAGALKVVPLQVGGAFHSPYMASAAQALQEALEQTPLQAPRCPVYQNIAPNEGRIDPELLRQGLNLQLTGAVQWTQSVRAMLRDGATQFSELGPGKVLQGLMRKIDRQAQVVAMV
ncbi:MAG: ACP S-malonyltransferase [Bacteroidota bacterium]